MKSSKHFLEIISVFFLVFILLLVNSCKKVPVSRNTPPTVNAGIDERIILPRDSLTLRGFGYDVDGTIRSYTWTQKAGPSQAVIDFPSSQVVDVKRLVYGIYEFELMVTDNEGAVGKDQVKVRVDSFSNSVNRPPVANAGIDQVIDHSIGSAVLNGTNSFDPDGNIVKYEWTKVSGPASFQFSNPLNSINTAGILDIGQYLFELKVSDFGNLSSRDTVKIDVITQRCDQGFRTATMAQLIPIGQLSVTRSGIGTCSAGNKIFFAGGQVGDYVFSDRVDVYDASTNSWSSLTLSKARTRISVISTGNKIFFAGGEWYDVWDNMHTEKVVDIYDLNSGQMSTILLSEAKSHMTVAAVGDKVFFAGGYNESYWSDKIEIYSLSTNSWLPPVNYGREGQSAVTLNNKVYFAGGETNSGTLSSVVNVYDNNSGTWSTQSLQQPKTRMAGVSFNGKIYWAGGFNSTGSNSFYYRLCSVEIFDQQLNSTEYSGLFERTEYPDKNITNALVRNNQVLFHRMYVGNPSNHFFDVYDVSTKTWSLVSLPARLDGTFVAAGNNSVYLAGGFINGVLGNQVYRVQF